MIRILITIFVFIPVSTFGQKYVGKSKGFVREELYDYMTKNSSLSINLSESDSTISLAVKGREVTPAEFIYTFDKQGKCIIQETKAFCDSCLKKYLQTALDQKEYGWKKLNENQFVSEYSKRLLLEIPPENKDFAFRILLVEWTKQTYEGLF